MTLWARRDAATEPAADPGATQVVAGARPARARTGGFLSLGTVFVVVSALSATLLGGGLATRHSDILDGNTWIVAASRDGVERLLRVNPGAGEVDLETPSPLPRGHTAQVEQSNSTTAVVDATTGDTFAWDPVAGNWQKSTTRVSGATALHLTSTAAFAVDRAEGTVRQLAPGLLSAPIGAPISLGAMVSESVVDGSGKLWLALPEPRRVVSVEGSDQGPTVVREFTVPSSGAALTLTARRSGVLAGDAAGHTTYRLFPERKAAERIAGVPPSTAAVSATTSDDDTGAVLDQPAGTLIRVTPAGDDRAQSVRLGARISGHRLGRPVVFGDHVYLPDFSTGIVLRSTAGGTLEPFPPQRMAEGGGDFGVFVDDDRLWVNSRTGARAFSVDPAGRWTPTTKFERKRILPPRAEPTRSTPARTTAPTQPDPTREADQPARTTPPQPTRRPTTRPPTPKPATPEPTTPAPTTTVPAVAPGAPGNLAATAADGAVIVTWAAPAEGKVTGYLVEWTGPDGATKSAEAADDARKYEISGLTNGAAYVISVTAVTDDLKSDPTRISATPVTTAGVTLTGAAAAGIGKVTVNYSVDTHDSGGVTCRILFNGAPKWSGGCAGTGSQKITGLAVSTGYTVTVTATNNQGTTTSAGKAVTTWAAPSVKISKGASAKSDSCTDPSCAYITVSIANFDPNTTYTMNGTDTHDPTPLPDRPITAGANGATTLTGPNKTYFYGFQGESVTIRVGGYASAPLKW